MVEIAVSVITGIFTFAGVVLTVIVGNRKAFSEMSKKLEVAQAVTDTKLEELTREVREHNNFAKRMPVLEQRVDAIEKSLDK